MRNLNKIILHCADTKPSMDVGVEEIRSWHLARGWNDVGYHFVIRKDGTIEKGRDVSIKGSHCYGHNTGSIGICWIGGFGGVDDRTECQKESLIELMDELICEYGDLSIHGHNEFSTKSCPNFNVKEEYNHE